MDALRIVVAAVALVIAAPRADAGPATASSTGPAGVIALLPLDAEPALELYGQPIASEIARALTGGGYVVAVVGAHAALPDGVQLIVDGKITTKGAEVVIALRVRNPKNGKVLAEPGDKAPGVASLDRTTAKLSTHMLQVIHEQLEVLAREAEAEAAAPAPHVRGPLPPVLPPMRSFVLATGGKASALATALATTATQWAHARGREPQPIELGGLAAQTAVANVVAHRADSGISLDAVALEITHGAVPLARATVRVRIASAARIVFDRTVVTDSVVGDRGMTDDALAARAAAAVLDIIAPHLARGIPAWAR